MSSRGGIVLLIDGIVNLILGIVLLLYPSGLAGALGLPLYTAAFYPTVLGAVLFGIGIALFIEWYGRPTGATGLGIAGAVAINLCGGSALLLWLAVGGLAIPVRGRIILWTMTLLVLLLGVAEGVLVLRRERQCGP